MKIRRYYFEFPDQQKNFCYALKSGPAEVKESPDKPISPPGWTRLNCHRCSHCSLSDQDVDYCPPAVNMVQIVERFSECNSYDEVKIFITHGVQKHSTVTNLQTALAYLFPFVLLESACPYAPLLRPLGKFTKPFPDLNDILFYLLSFDLVKKRVLAGTTDSTGAQDSGVNEDSYNITMTLHGLLNRLRAASHKEANINAIIKDIQWSYCMFHSQNEILDRLRPYFAKEHGLNR